MKRAAVLLAVLLVGCATRPDYSREVSIANARPATSEEQRWISERLKAGFCPLLELNDTYMVVECAPWERWLIHWEGTWRLP
jgi:hypothetical protein